MFLETDDTFLKFLAWGTKNKNAMASHKQCQSKLIVDEIADQLLEEVKKTFTACGKLSDECLSLCCFQSLDDGLVAPANEMYFVMKSWEDNVMISPCLTHPHGVLLPQPLTPISDCQDKLHFIYQGPLLTALELVEKQSVTCVISPSGKELFQVIGASGTPYTCFPKLKYCSCPAFHFSVLCKEDHVMCKHVLAMKLSEIMGLTKILHVSNAEITNMIISIE